MQHAARRIVGPGDKLVLGINNNIISTVLCWYFNKYIGTSLACSIIILLV